MTGDPAWKEFERISREKDREKKDRGALNHFRNFVLPVLRIIEDADCYSELMWRTDVLEDRVVFSLLCSDTFAYASADAEPIETALDVARLYSVFWELSRLEKRFPDSVALAFLPELYAARRRKMQPLPAWLTAIAEGRGVRELFEELPPNTFGKKEEASGSGQADVPEVLPAAPPGETEGMPRPGLGQAMPGSAL